MINIEIDLSRLPRTMTRAQWRAADRWRRQARRRMQQANPDWEAVSASLRSRMVAFGTRAYVMNNGWSVVEVDLWG